MKKLSWEDVDNFNPTIYSKWDESKQAFELNQDAFLAFWKEHELQEQVIKIRNAVSKKMYTTLKNKNLTGKDVLGTIEQEVRSEFHKVLIAPKERRYSKKGKMIAPLQQAFTNTLNSLNLMHKRDLKHGARFAPDSIRIVEYDEEHADLGAIYNLDSKTIAISYKHSEITEHDFLVYCAEMNPDFLGVCIGKKWMKRYNIPIMVENEVKEVIRLMADYNDSNRMEA